MRFLAVDLLVILAVIGGLYVIYRYMIRHMELKKLDKVAYFSGGPLNGTQQKLLKFPRTYSYQYDRPRLIKSREGSVTPESVPCWYNALYQHTGLGVYEYQGSTVIDADQVTYDPADDNA